jgi:formylglycine-generating enzyme required for sulfatase activity
MTPYSFGQEITKQQVNFGTDKPTPVGSFKPNKWGFYDMHGNVWEWVNDWSSTFSASRKVDPMGPAKGDSKVYKGGCFVNNLPDENRSTSRYGRNPATYKYAHVGFRVSFKPIQ